MSIVIQNKECQRKNFKSSNFGIFVIFSFFSEIDKGINSNDKKNI